jgi:hypothetical protein
MARQEGNASRFPFPRQTDAFAFASLQKTAEKKTGFYLKKLK